MRYITFLWDNYFRRYLAKTVELLFTVRILNCPTVSLLIKLTREFKILKSAPTDLKILTRALLEDCANPFIKI